MFSNFRFPSLSSMGSSASTTSANSQPQQPQHQPSRSLFNARAAARQSIAAVNGIDTFDVKDVVVANASRTKAKPAAPKVSAPTSSLDLAIRTNHPNAPAEADSEIAVLASLAARDQDNQEETRNPIDLVIVLDKSGSMQGDKLDLCKKTLEFLIEKGFTENDYLAIVGFDTNIHLEYEGGMMTKENKDIALQRVARIQSGSSTNLSGGLFSGLDVLQKASTAEVSAICLLTDGMMNHGLTDRDQIIRILQERIAEFPKGKAKPSVFTFGYGTDADILTMKAISEATGSTYYSIVNPESVPIAFADCLGGLTAVAAQNVELTIEVAGGGAEILGDPLTKFPFNKLSTTACTIKIKDMYCGERRDIVFKVKLPKSSTSTAVNVTSKFTDTINETFQSLSSSVEIARYPGSARQEGPPDVEVTRHLVRVEAARAMDEARMAGERGDYASGKTRIDGLIRTTKETILSLGLSEEDDAMMLEVCEDLKLASDNLSSSEQFRTVGQAQMASASVSHQYQRSNKVDSMMSEGMEERGAYANRSKIAMMKSAKNTFGFS